MRMNLTLKSLKDLNLKRSLFTLERVFMSWKAEFVYVKMLFFKRVLKEFYQGLLSKLISEFKKVLNHKKSADLVLK